MTSTPREKFEKETGQAAWINSDIYPDGKVSTQSYVNWLEKQLQDTHRLEVSEDAFLSDLEIESLATKKYPYNPSDLYGYGIYERSGFIAGYKQSLSDRFKDVRPDDEETYKDVVDTVDSLDCYTYGYATIIKELKKKFIIKRRDS